MGLFSKDIKTLDDLFVHTLQDVYYAENQITKALPKMIDTATDPELRRGFEQHLRETENQIRRLEQVFQMHGHQPKAEGFGFHFDLGASIGKAKVTARGTGQLATGMESPAARSIGGIDGSFQVAQNEIVNRAASTR